MLSVEEYIRHLENPKAIISYLPSKQQTSTGHIAYVSSTQAKLRPPIQIIRRPGLGDKVFALAATYAFVQKHPDWKVSFWGLDTDRWLQLIDWVNIALDKEAKTVVNLDNTPFNGGDRAQLMGEALGVEVEDIRFPIRIPKYPRPVLAKYYVFVPFANRYGPRSLPFKVVQKILDKIDIKTVLVDANPFEYRTKNSKVINLSGQLSVEELISVLHNAEGVFGVDTGVIYLAAALGKPTLCFFGHVSAKERTQTIKNMLAIEAQVPCGPCGDIIGVRPQCQWKDAVPRCIAAYDAEFVLYTLSEFRSQLC